MSHSHKSSPPWPASAFSGLPQHTAKVGGAEACLGRPAPMQLIIRRILQRVDLIPFSVVALPNQAPARRFQVFPGVSRPRTGSPGAGGGATGAGASLSMEVCNE